jgi:adenylyl-sulfate kinase
VWLTGLPAAGKSTTAEAVARKLTELGQPVLVLDGDVVRRSALPPLGFSKADRDEQVRRVASLARAALDDGNVVICALVSPYRAARAEAKTIVGAERFLEVFVDTPLAVCEARDPKSLYARSRRGDLDGLTGVDDPYEPPAAPDLVLTTADRSVDDNAARVIAALTARAFRPGI